MAHAGVVRSGPTDVHTDSSPAAKDKNSSHTATGSRQEPPAVSKTPFDFVCTVRSTARDRGFSEFTSKVLSAAWRSTTQTQYRSYWSKWLLFCSKRQVDPMQISINLLFDFLGELFQAGLSYSALNTARSTIVNMARFTSNNSVLENSDLINRFMRGIFNLRPSLPKYTNTWDVSHVLGFLSGLFPLKTLDLLTLGAKLALLLLLLTGQRGQTIHALKLQDVVESSTQLCITYSSPLKQTKPGKHVPGVTLKAFSDPSLCVVKTLIAYKARTLPLRGPQGKALFISTMKPFHSASRDTISRWVKFLLHKAGVDTGKFQSHSTRAASTSAAAKAAVPLDTILKTAGWASQSTFRKFYDKPVTENTGFADGILAQCHTVAADHAEG